MHNDITHEFITPAMSWGSLQNLHFNKTLGWFLNSEKQNSDADSSETVSYTPTLSSKSRLTFPGILWDHKGRESSDPSGKNLGVLGEHDWSWGSWWCGSLSVSSQMGRNDASQRTVPRSFTPALEQGCISWRGNVAPAYFMLKNSLKKSLFSLIFVTL